jgi:hypothetical protein
VPPFQWQRLGWVRLIREGGAADGCAGKPIVKFNAARDRATIRFSAEIGGTDLGVVVPRATVFILSSTLKAGLVRAPLGFAGLDVERCSTSTRVDLKYKSTNYQQTGGHSKQTRAHSWQSSAHIKQRAAHSNQRSARTQRKQVRTPSKEARTPNKQARFFPVLKENRRAIKTNEWALRAKQRALQQLRVGRKMAIWSSSPLGWVAARRVTTAPEDDELQSKSAALSGIEV